ncbi:PQQ-binding-like beta-propeller repeat protein [Longibacter salinarum]|nr:PQQ-binding-like beta-propeller repeat protein [Longibacter salinarum]
MPKTASPPLERPERDIACSTLTIPDDWSATTSGREGKVIRVFDQTYRVHQYLAPNVLDGVQTVKRSAAIVPVVTAVSDPARPSDDRSINSGDELLGVLAHYMNVNSNGLSIRVENEWAKRAREWKEQRLNIYDPRTGKVATGLIQGGKLLTSAGASMATADITGLSSISVTAADFVINLGSTTLSFFESITATPDDRSLAPAIAALGDLDPEYRRKVMELQGSRRYLRRYYDVSSDLDDVRSNIQFAATEWKNISRAIQNYRAATDPVLINTRGGKQALSNAHEFMGASLASAGLSVAEELVFRDVDDLTSGFNELIYTANLYATVLEAYARQLEMEQSRLNEPGGFNSWTSYAEALAQYQYRVGRYHEVKLGLITNLYEYANKLNNVSGLGFGIFPSMSSLSIPDESVETYRKLMRRQRVTYERVLKEVTEQMHVIDLTEKLYPDYAERACSEATRGISKGPLPTVKELITRNDKVYALTENDDGEKLWKEWLKTERPEARIAHQTERTAYVVDGKAYRTRESNLYALAIRTGQVRWKKEIGGYRRASVAAVRNDTLFVSHTAGSTSSRVLALDAATGDNLWVFDEHYLVASRFSFHSGVLLFVDGGTPYAGSGARSTSSLYAVNVETGDGLWSKELTGRTRAPNSNVDYSVRGEVVEAKNTRTGKTYRLDLRIGESLQPERVSRCDRSREQELIESAFGEFAPNSPVPDASVDLNNDGVNERFFQQLGTNRRGQILVIAISGAAPCRQLFSSIFFDSDWDETLSLMRRQRNGYEVFEVEGRTYAFDGERYSRID